MLSSRTPDVLKQLHLRPRGTAQPLVRPWVWGMAGLAALGVAAYAWLPRAWETVPVIDQKTSVNIPAPVWNGYKRAPRGA